MKRLLLTASILFALSVAGNAWAGIIAPADKTVYPSGTTEVCVQMGNYPWTDGYSYRTSVFAWWNGSELIEQARWDYEFVSTSYSTRCIVGYQGGPLTPGQWAFVVVWGSTLTGFTESGSIEFTVQSATLPPPPPEPEPMPVPTPAPVESAPEVTFSPPTLTPKKFVLKRGVRRGMIPYFLGDSDNGQVLRLRWRIHKGGQNTKVVMSGRKSNVSHFTVGLPLSKLQTTKLRKLKGNRHTYCMRAFDDEGGHVTPWICRKVVVK